MVNLTKYPLEDGFETSLAQEWDGQLGTVNLNKAPSFTFPSGVTTYMVVDPGKTTMQIAEIDSINVGNKTVNVSNITLEKGAGINSTATNHTVNAKVIISDNYQFWKDIATAINSKLDSNGGNTTTSFNLSVTGSNFRIRKDGADMKLRDDNNPEVSLSDLAAAAGVDKKVSITINDTTAGVLDTKLTAGNGITKQVNNLGGDENLEVGVDMTYINNNITPSVESTQSTFVAGENITQADIDNGNNALYQNTDGKVYKTDASNSSKINFIGFATNPALANENVIVDTSGIHTRTIASGDIGKDFYLGYEYSNETGLNINGTSFDNNDFYWASSRWVKGSNFSFKTPSNKISIVSIDIKIRGNIGNEQVVAEIYNTYNGTLLFTSAPKQITGTMTIQTIPINSGYLTGNTFAIRIRGVLGTENLMWRTEANDLTSNMYHSINYSREYISNSLGVISTTPGTNVVSVGKAVSATGIQINSFDGRNKIIEFTRVMNASSGTVSYSHNLGKLPKEIIIMGGYAATSVSYSEYFQSKGTWDGTNQYSISQNRTAGIVFDNTAIISACMSTAVGQKGIIQNITSTGFDIAWTLVNGGAGGVNARFIAILNF